MKGSTPPQIAEIIIKLVKDMAGVSFCCICIPSFNSMHTQRIIPVFINYFPKYLGLQFLDLIPVLSENAFENRVQ